MTTYLVQCRSSLLKRLILYFDGYKITYNILIVIREESTEKRNRYPTSPYSVMQFCVVND